MIYGAGLYLIAYLVFTPHGAPTIWGVQGRYFAPVLPLLAITVAALIAYAAIVAFFLVLLDIA